MLRDGHIRTCHCPTLRAPALLRTAVKVLGLACKEGIFGSAIGLFSLDVDLNLISLSPSLAYQDRIVRHMARLVCAVGCLCHFPCHIFCPPCALHRSASQTPRTAFSGTSLPPDPLTPATTTATAARPTGLFGPWEPPCTTLPRLQHHSSRVRALPPPPCSLARSPARSLCTAMRRTDVHTSVLPPSPAQCTRVASRVCTAAVSL